MSRWWFIYLCVCVCWTYSACRWSSHWWWCWFNSLIKVSNLNMQHCNWQSFFCFSHIGLRGKFAMCVWIRTKKIINFFHTINNDGKWKANRSACVCVFFFSKNWNHFFNSILNRHDDDDNNLPPTIHRKHMA